MKFVGIGVCADTVCVLILPVRARSVAVGEICRYRCVLILLAVGVGKISSYMCAERERSVGIGVCCYYLCALAKGV